MTTLVLGASGATGRILVQHLLAQGQSVKIVARALGDLPETILRHQNLSAIQASVPDLEDAELTDLVRGCDAVAVCLGHNMTLKGLFGHPRRLVADATRRVCQAIHSSAPQSPVKFVLMNTTGNRNQDQNEKLSVAERCVFGILRLLLPPHADNELAADYLRRSVDQADKSIEWVIVRPDNLINAAETSVYEIHKSPQRSAIFDAGETSRVNVADFMARLLQDNRIWQLWKGQMPVIYNRASSK